MRIIVKRLMSGQHVVIGGHDGNVGDLARRKNGFLGSAAGSKTVGEIGARHMPAPRLGIGRLADMIEVSLPGRSGSPGDALGDESDFRMNRLGRGWHRSRLPL